LTYKQRCVASKNSETMLSEPQATPTPLDVVVIVVVVVVIVGGGGTAARLTDA
jgi:hypothetical protein